MRRCAVRRPGRAVRHLADPFVLTPGDNEWTDCHRTAAGGYLPTERLDALRRVFYTRAGHTTGGRTTPVLTQAIDPTDTPGFAAIRQRIATHSRAFGKPVLLVHGDEHIYEVEPGYAGVPNLTRLETFGDTATQWLRVTANPRTHDVFSWEPLSIG